VDRRARSLSPFVRALEGGGRRSDPAFEILDDMGHQICPGLADAMRAATPALLQRLGAPTPPIVVPLDPEDEARWTRALRTLTADGVNRELAEAPVRAFLAHDETVALAARTLARMGTDATAAVPQLRIASCPGVRVSLANCTLFSLDILHDRRPSNSAVCRPPEPSTTLTRHDSQPRARSRLT